MRRRTRTITAVAAAILTLPSWAPPLLAQSSALTVEEAREDFARMGRDGGYWVASNETYAVAGSGEPDEYRMSFTTTADGYSVTGCMWGDSNDDATVPFWRFFHAWDPTTESVLAYQSSPGGGVAVGRERRWRDGGTEAIQTIVFPGGEPSRVRHLNRVLSDGRLDSRSFDPDPARPGAWIERRAYVWEWRPSAESVPC